jgi:hypothetical protein
MAGDEWLPWQAAVHAAASTEDDDQHVGGHRPPDVEPARRVVQVLHNIAHDTRHTTHRARGGVGRALLVAPPSTTQQEVEKKRRRRRRRRWDGIGGRRWGGGVRT